MSHIHLFCLFTLAITSFASYAEQKTLYGADDRQETYLASKKIQQIAAAVVALIPKEKLKKDPKTQQYQFTEVSRLSDGDMCNSERFAQQPSVAGCTGTLVAKDLVMTAAHCVDDVKTGTGPIYDKYWVVFGYQMYNNKQWKTHYSEQDVYEIKENVIKPNYDVQIFRDEALVRLKRVVADHHQPLSLSAVRQYKVATELTMIGYPLGLPQKVTNHGHIVRRNDDGDYVSDVDAFHGNSGSPVFVTSSLASDRPQLVGVLSFGEPDTRLDNQRQCKVSHRCEQAELKSYACQGETISPVEKVSEYFQRLGKEKDKKTY